MYLKDHKQKMTLGRGSTRKEKRCVMFAIILVLIIVFGIYEHPTWSQETDLKLETTRPYAYTSSPEAGMPKLPFKNSSKREANTQPWWGEEEYDDDHELHTPIMKLVEQTPKEI